MRIRSVTAIVITVLAATATPAAGRAGAAEAVTPAAAKAAKAGPAAEPSWAKYVSAPSSRDVKPVRVLATTGAVTNPHGLIGNGVATLSRPQPAPRPAWPAGTTATASSFHPPNNGNDGQPRSYVPGNAVDGNTGHVLERRLHRRVPGRPDDHHDRGGRAARHHPAVQRRRCDRGLHRRDLGRQRLVTSRDRDRQQRRPGARAVHRAGDHDAGADHRHRGAVVRQGRLHPGQRGVSGPGRRRADPQRHRGLRQGRRRLPACCSWPVRQREARGCGSRSRRRSSTSPTSPTSPASYNGDRITPGTDQVAVKAEPYTWKDTHGCAEGTKVCADGLHGFRYLKISLDALPADAPLTQPYGKVKIDGVALDFTRLPRHAGQLLAAGSSRRTSSSTSTGTPPRTPTS